MSTTHPVFSAHIAGPPEVIFDLIADMPHYGRWLPGSQAFGGTTRVTPYPVQLGTAYLDAGPAGQRPGSVTEFAPPKHIGFHHTMVLKLGPFAGDADVHILYTLESEAAGTHVIRALDLTLELPGLASVAKPLVIYAFRRENQRILAALKRYVENLPKRDVTVS
jgi:uncharacterized protein YndB with AHSA1/START domain